MEARASGRGRLGDGDHFVWQFLRLRDSEGACGCGRRPGCGGRLAGGGQFVWQFLRLLGRAGA